MKLLIHILFVSSIPCFNTHSAPVNEGIALVNEMLEAIDRIESLSMVVISKERISGTYRHEKTFMRMTPQPLRIYFKQEYPFRNLEGLYLHDQNDQKVLLHTGGLLWFDFGLDPQNFRMRITHHHPATNLGFHHLAGIIEYALTKSPVISVTDIVTEDTIPVKRIYIYLPDYKIIQYKVKEKTTATQLGDKLMINDHKILHLNENLDALDKPIKEDSIKIPTAYGKEFIILLDQETHLPRRISVFDELGLFEEYSFEQVKINQCSSPELYKPDYHEYGFKD